MEKYSQYSNPNLWAWFKKLTFQTFTEYLKKSELMFLTEKLQNNWKNIVNIPIIIFGCVFENSNFKLLQNTLKINVF